MTAAAGALVLAAALGAVMVLDTRQAAVVAGAAGAVLLLSLGLGRARGAAISFALVLLGAIYAIPEGDRALAAPFYGAALLLIAELAYWSLDERSPQRASPGTFTPRLLAVLALTLVSVPASAVVLAAAEPDVARSPALTAAGAAAIVACIALIAALARGRGGGTTPS